jgi:hypothetical protein
VDIHAGHSHNPAVAVEKSSNGTASTTKSAAPGSEEDIPWELLLSRKEVGQDAGQAVLPN